MDKSWITIKFDKKLDENLNILFIGSSNFFYCLLEVCSIPSNVKIPTGLLLYNSACLITLLVMKIESVCHCAYHLHPLFHCTSYKRILYIN